MDWNGFYAKVTGPIQHGDERTYRITGEFLKDCAEVEDWGCGTAWLRHYVRGRYIGVDGWSGQYANCLVDLVDYLSHTEGICIRHVLEYNVEWQVIVANALASMTKRMVIVLSTPLIDSGSRVEGQSDVTRSRKLLKSMLSETSYTITGLPGLNETMILVSAKGVEHEQALTEALIQ